MHTQGTVRSNLDPFCEASDNELWHALALVHLRDAIAGAQGEGGAEACVVCVCPILCATRPLASRGKDGSCSFILVS